MRPLDEDRHDRAVVFTHRRERPFDSQKWFIDRFLSGSSCWKSDWIRRNRLL